MADSTAISLVAVALSLAAVAGALTVVFAAARKRRDTPGDDGE